MRPWIQRAIRGGLARLGYHVYRIETPVDRRGRLYLEETTSFAVSDLPIPDKRADTIYDRERGLDTTLVPEGLAAALGFVGLDRLRGKRVLEIGPKFGFHTLWVDRNLAPSELVLCELPRKIPETGAWRDQIACKHRWIYESILAAEELFELDPFDLVLCLGVIYHNAHPARLLNILNRVTRPGGHLLLESTIDARPDPVLRLYYGDFTKMFPSVAALRILLAWSGWRKVVQFRDYRPGSHEALFLCEKTEAVDFDSPLPHESLRPPPAPEGPGAPPSAARG
jgi:SAM-dependent methyltransferase